jgi:hypothetical protein
VIGSPVLRAIGVGFTLFLAISWCASAQVLEVRGGNSSLYEAGGGAVELHTQDYNFVAGAGTESGHIEYGARLEREVGNTRYIVGDDHVNFRLPTDIFGSTPYLYTRGVSVKTNLQGNDLLLFGGVESNVYSTPLFDGGTLGEGLGFVSLHRKLSSHWQLYSNTVISSKQSEILGFQWDPLAGTEFSLSGGVGSNQPYGAASLHVEREWLDLKAAYIQAGHDFERIVLSNPVFAEPNKGNLLVTVHPTHYLSFTGGTQNYLVPITTGNGRYTGQSVASSADQVGMSLIFLKANLSGSLYESKYQGQVDHAGTVTIQRPITRRILVMSSWMASRPKGSGSTNNFLTTVSENLTSRLSLNQSVNVSNGTTNMLYGGSIQYNLVSISANYESFYVPSLGKSPFENALILDVNIHLFGRARLHGQTFVGPTGKLLYTADAYGMASRDPADLPPIPQQRSIGNSEMHGRVVDPENIPVEGAALMIDQKQVYTDSQGQFELRERKPQIHKLTVLTDEFLANGSWEIVRAPTFIRSTENDAEPESIIVVRRKSVASIQVDQGENASSEAHQK